MRASTWLRAIITATTIAATATAGAGAAQATPTVRPAVKRTFVGADPGTFCRYGYLCAFVRGDGGYYRFDFTRCDIRYRVSGWHRHGFISNSEFGGVTAVFFTRSGGVYDTRRSRGVSGISWEPVWSLLVC